MRAGPKGAVTADPLDFRGWPKGRAARRERFIGEYLVTPRGHGAGDPFKLRPFQREIIRGSFAPGIRSAVVSIPARAELMKHTLQSMTAAKVSGAKLDTDPPVSFGNIKPDNLIRLFNYGDTLHFGEKRQELVSLLEDGFEKAYFRYGALISILGLSQLYFGFAVLVDAALGGVA